MKEIDFLPDWYKQQRVQKKKHREFYFALGLIIAIMALWIAFANGRLALIKAKNATLQNTKLLQSRSEAEYAAAESEYQRLGAESGILKSVGHRIAVSNVLAELAYLLDGKVVLKKIEIKTEPLESQGSRKVANTASAAKAEQISPFEKDEKFKIVLTGFAPDAAEVAEVINGLEHSSYFFQIVPGFSKNVTVEKYQASEFEISCYLANFKQN